MAKILVVEDRDDVQITLKAILKLDKHEVVFAKTLEEAKLQFTVQRPDFVITDHEFPEKEGGFIEDKGYEMIRHIREGSWGKTPIIWNTGREEIPKQIALDQGADFALYKPFDIKELRSIVAQCAQLGKS